MNFRHFPDLLAPILHFEPSKRRLHQAGYRFVSSRIFAVLPDHVAGLYEFFDGKLRVRF